ncbi:MAG: AAA family ATPase [Paludibacteraceae bacterium]|nr:AAA family ATPase [Paludibacteraceae bacterium]
MEQIIEKFRKRIANTETIFVRSIMYHINWEARLIGLKGARGVGKTTLLLQYIKLNHAHELDKTLYISLDNIWFADNKLIDLVDLFVKRGGKYLFLDEVHKYANWSVEIKNIYDDYPELKVVFTGSSLLEILNARADLSRRAVIYNMQGLSFREYLNIELNINLKSYTLDELILGQAEISKEIVSQLKPLQYFETYLQKGYYPFYREVPNLYYSRLEEVINMILEIELPLLRNVNVTNVPKLKQLIYVVTESAPFTPNISKISERIGINRETILSYLYYLNEAHLLFSSYKNAKGITALQKPDKLFLENTNLMYAINGRSVNIGNARETFFANQLRNNHLVEISNQTDFIVDKKYSFEIGGKNKNKSQIEGLNDSFIALDNIEYGFENKIPLWIFGFLY